MKSLEANNFIFDTGIVMSPSGDKAVVLESNAALRQAQSNIKVRASQRKYTDDFLSNNKTPQA